MEKTLGELFGESRGMPVDYRGQKVYPMWSVTGSNGNVVVLEFVSVEGSCRQGVALSCKDGKVEVNGKTFDRGVLWTDTAPRVVTITLRTKRPNMSLNLWNTWEDELGVRQAWLGNAGILIDPSQDSIILRCSRGGGEADFSSLVVKIHPKTVDSTAVP